MKGPKTTSAFCQVSSVAGGGWFSSGQLFFFGAQDSRGGLPHGGPYPSACRVGLFRPRGVAACSGIFVGVVSPLADSARGPCASAGARGPVLYPLTPVSCPSGPNFLSTTEVVSCGQNVGPKSYRYGRDAPAPCLTARDEARDNKNPAMKKDSTRAPRTKGLRCPQRLQPC